MKVRKDRWHYPLYALVTPAPWVPQTRCTFACRATLNTLGLLVLLACAAVLAAVSGIVTVAVNLVTVPLGFGFAATFFGTDFLRVPFRIRQGGKDRSLANFLVPFWAGVATIVSIWFGMSNRPAATVSILAFLMLAAGVLIAKKESLCQPVEIVEA